MGRSMYSKLQQYRTQAQEARASTGSTLQCINLHEFSISISISSNFHLQFYLYLIIFSSNFITAFLLTALRFPGGQTRNAMIFCHGCRRRLGFRFLKCFQLEILIFEGPCLLVRVYKLETAY
ncbi:uncharacterized protein [Spinacia oleracea]|uniref:Yippee domain-containing protein n=1 Tax=Spinacia oleracea TaxID=3562 RepID=A0ABM3QLS7_SPIOL|nr:uncharacterized protein LOC110783405 [Spinacia oleracea]